MLTTILIVVAVLVIGVLLVAATRPADVRVRRTATLAAPPGNAKVGAASRAGASVAQA